MLAMRLMRLQRDGLSLAFFSTLTALATPRDVTLEHLRPVARSAAP